MPKELSTPKVAAPNADKRKPPHALLDWRQNKTLHIELSGDWDRLQRATGNEAVCQGLAGHASTLGAPGQRIHQDTTDFVLGFVDAMKPRDPAEALLAAQMAVTHEATMLIARRVLQSESGAGQDVAERAMNKTARTFAAQMDTLKRYRSKGQQTVRVERVNVEGGGQAIVGNVETGGAVTKVDGNPMHPAAGIS